MNNLFAVVLSVERTIRSLLELDGKVCMLAAAARMSGIDVSHYQEEIDWQQVRHVGVVFAFVKATEGTSFGDRMFDRNWMQAKDAGILRGAYHFFRPKLDPVAQAHIFLEKLQYDAGELPPVLDIEVMNTAPERVIDRAQQWLEIVESALQYKPIIYTGSAFWRSTLRNSPALNSHPLWIAHYTTSPSPLIPSAWQKWTFWQFSQAGRMPGIKGNVDLDVFNGSASDLEAFCVNGVTNVKDGIPV